MRFMLALALSMIFISVACGSKTIGGQDLAEFSQEIDQALEKAADDIRQKPKEFGENVPGDSISEIDATPSLAPILPSVGVEAGQRAPDFELSGLQLTIQLTESGGSEYIYTELKDVRLSDFRGKVVFLNFWASWCRVCRIEMPSLRRMYQDYKNLGFILLAVEIRQDEGEEKVRAYVEETKLTFPVLLDSGEIADLYKVLGTPTNFIIDLEGIIMERISGSTYNWDSLMGRGLVEPLLPVKFP